MAEGTDMLLALAIQELTRTAFLSGAMCSGLATEPFGADCVRISGGATCVLPAGVKVSGEVVILEWRDSMPAPTVLATGDAKVESKQGSFSGHQAWLRYNLTEKKVVLDEVGFYLNEFRRMELACHGL
jgi:hypothetical protein